MDTVGFGKPRDCSSAKILTYQLNELSTSLSYQTPTLSGFFISLLDDSEASPLTHVLPVTVACEKNRVKMSKSFPSRRRSCFWGRVYCLLAAHAA